MSNFQKAIETFQAHYADRLGGIQHETRPLEGVEAYHFFDNSEKLRPGNGPRILYHGQATAHVIVLTHGLSDSPYYLFAIAQRLYAEGANIVMPLLPAHGLIDPDKAMEDKTLDQKWRACIDNGVETAQLIGGKISVGGFSTGGALSLNKILRNPELIDGGLFLFSAALSVGDLNESAGRLGFIQSFTKFFDGQLPGIGQDPYKYPRLPNFAGLELIQIINENNSKLRNHKISQPVIALHSINDETAFAKGITDFIESHVEKGTAIFIAQDVAHSELPLDKAVDLDMSIELGPVDPPMANPQFEFMMNGTILFLKSL